MQRVDRLIPKAALVASIAINAHPSTAAPEVGMQQLPQVDLTSMHTGATESPMLASVTTGREPIGKTPCKNITPVELFCPKTRDTYTIGRKRKYDYANRTPASEIEMVNTPVGTDPTGKKLINISEKFEPGIFLSNDGTVVDFVTVSSDHKITGYEAPRKGNEKFLPPPPVE